jgi:excisionase family DNA binding protein
MAIQPHAADPCRLTINQAATEAGCHPNTIRNLIKRGELPAYRIGERIVRVNKSDLDALFTPVVGGEYSVWNR